MWVSRWMFEASLNKAAQLGTQLALASCYETLGKTASAWGEFHAASSTAAKAHDRRQVFAAEHAAVLEPKLSKLVFKLEPGYRVDGLEIKRDGVVVSAAELGAPVPVDPGDHTIEASAPGWVAWSNKVSVMSPGVIEVIVPALDRHLLHRTRRGRGRRNPAVYHARRSRGRVRQRPLCAPGCAGGRTIPARRGSARRFLMKPFQNISCFALATIGALTAGCNSVLGIGDVALDPDAGVAVSTPPPDADRSACKLDAHFSQITMTGLSRGMDGSPNIFVQLNDADALLITLHDNKGGHGTLQTFGTYQLTSADSKLETCGICVLAGADFNSTSQSFAQDYAPRMQGQLQITTATTTQLIGSMQDLVLRHVNLDTGTQTTTDASDGCATAIDEIDFNLTYSSVAARLPMVGVLLTR